MNTKLITSSLRAPSAKSKKTSFFLNFRPIVVEELNLKQNRFVEVTKRDARYCVKFSENATARSRKISFKESYAFVSFAPEVFTVANDGSVENVSSFPIDAEYVDGNLEFEFDSVEFLKPRVISAETPKVTSFEDKVAARFKANSAWGIKVQGTVDRKIAANMEAEQHAKFWSRQC